MNSISIPGIVKELNCLNDKFNSISNTVLIEDEVPVNDLDVIFIAIQEKIEVLVDFLYRDNNFFYQRLLSEAKEQTAFDVEFFYNKNEANLMNNCEVLEAYILQCLDDEWGFKGSICRNLLNGEVEFLEEAK